MKDNLQLKSTLTRMAAEISKPTTIPVHDFHPERDSLQPATVTVSFTIPVIDAENYLELIQTVFGMRPHAAVTVATVGPTAPVPLPSTNSSSVKCERLSDKQNSLISNLVKRKKLTAGQIEEMVRSKFGVNERVLLDKRQASQLIDLLMAM